MAPQTARRFPQYAATTDPQPLAAYWAARNSYDQFLLQAHQELSLRFTGAEGNAAVAGGLLAGARITGFRHLDTELAPGRWISRDGIATPYAGGPARAAIDAVVHSAPILPGRPRGAITGTTADGAVLSSRGTVFADEHVLYSAYPMTPEAEFTREPIGQGWTALTAHDFAAAHTAWSQNHPHTPVT